jgi:uncharacterized protein (TIGR03083 family)
MVEAGSERGELAGYVATWWQAVDDLTAVLEELPDDAWATPTDLAGWDVHDVAAHVAHLESVLSGGPEATADIGEPGHVRGTFGRYCEQGVVERRDRTPDQLITEIRASATRRHTALLDSPPADADAPAEPRPGGTGWSWRALLRNRPLDVWMHEQDVRRAVGRPGGMDSPGAVHSAAYLAESLGFVLVKKVGAAPGTTLRLDVEGHEPMAFTVTDAGRGQQLPELPAEPDATISTDRESFVLLAGGRRVPPDGAVRLAGDTALAHRVVGELAVTP